MTECAKCGKEMECNPTGECWCKNLPPVSLVVGKFKGCLCKTCLAEEAGMTEMEQDRYKGMITAAGAEWLGIQPGYGGVERVILFNYKNITMGMHPSKMTNDSVKTHVKNKLRDFGIVLQPSVPQ